MAAAKPNVESVTTVQNIVGDLLNALLPLCQQELMEEKSWESLGELLPEVSAAVAELAVTIPEEHRQRVKDLAGKLQEVVMKMTDLVSERGKKSKQLRSALESLQRAQAQAGEWLDGLKV